MAMLSSLILAACTGPALSHRNSQIDLHLETSPQLPPPYSEAVTLPFNGEHLHIDPNPTFSTEDISHVQVLETEVLDKPVYLLALTFSPAAAIRLYSLTCKYPGRRMVLKIDGQPIGLKHIRYPTRQGFWWIPTQLNRRESERLALQLGSSPHFAFGKKH